ncbi:MAG: hypothetical protein V1493_03230, partial [Candidatus Diapherotrites archaeon]
MVVVEEEEGDGTDFINAEYSIPEAEFCKLTPGDVKSMTGNAFSEPKARLYNCMGAQECEASGGRHFLGKTYDPCSAQDQFCCYKPQTEEQKDSIAECAANENFNIYLEGEPASAEFIEKILASFPSRSSPALEENTWGYCPEGDGYKCSIGEAFVYFSTQPWSIPLEDGSTFTKSLQFDPLVPLAFFSYESGMGTIGTSAAQRRSIGNIRVSNDQKQLGLCVDRGQGEFCGYNFWWQSVMHWNWLIEENYIGQGQESLSDILYKYAPPSENDTEEYIATVKERVCEWREMFREYEAKSETRIMAALSLPAVVSKYIKPPKWFVAMIPSISNFVQTKLMFWKKDTDKDGIPDSRDKCPTQKENFNGFEDSDGCLDKASASPKTAVPGKASRQQIINSSPASIKGKRVVLFVPADFTESKSADFKAKAGGFFNAFIEAGGLESEVSSGKIVLVAGDVSEYATVAGCPQLKSDNPFSQATRKSIDSLGSFSINIQSCGENFLRKKYNLVPSESDYRVVTLLNTDLVFFYSTAFDYSSGSGISWYTDSKVRNRVLVINDEHDLLHELGHTFGFADQYLSSTYIE